VPLMLLVGTAILWRLLPGCTAVWLVGLGLGFVLQRSRFCFAAAFRDPLLTGDTRMLRALLLLLFVAAAGSSLFFLAGTDLQLRAWPSPWASLAGGTLFGIGMVLAGACAAMTLVRLGEGLGVYLLVLAAALATSLLGAYQLGRWPAYLAQLRPLFLPQFLGWPLTALTLFGLFLAMIVLSFCQRGGAKR